MLYFQSNHELGRWLDLELLQKAGQISGLQRQITFPLAWDDNVIQTPTGRRMKHTVDFEYTENGEVVLEDAKGSGGLKDLGHIKRELVRIIYGYEIRLY